MGLYIRKSVSVGPFRFNLSKSGVGISAGVKGFRVGTGPRGNYVHMGRGGIYYRASLSPKESPRFEGARRLQNHASPPPAVVESATHGLFTEIDSGAITDMVDSSSRELVSELNSKRKKLPLWWIVAGAISLLLAFSAPYLSSLAFGWFCAVGVLLTAVTFYLDLIRRTTVILYDIESDYGTVLEQFHVAFEQMMSCRAAWHMSARASVHNSKYHAGAGHLVKRSTIRLAFGNAPYVKTNVKVPTIPVGKQVLYFFPDKVLVFDALGVGAVSYENLAITVSNRRFIEEGGVPMDSKVVDQTWRFVNKKGGPDRRFNNNRQIPVCLYEEVDFTSDTGLRERIQLSAIGRTEAFRAGVRAVVQGQKS